MQADINSITVVTYPTYQNVYNVYIYIYTYTIYMYGYELAVDSGDPPTVLFELMAGSTYLATPLF